MVVPLTGACPTAVAAIVGVSVMHLSRNIQPVAMDHHGRLNQHSPKQRATEGSGVRRSRFQRRA
eukprot:41620-Eustigmatos_ZCMA.PRE.1